MIDDDIPPRAKAAEERRAFRDLLSRSSLGCPNEPNCGHLIGNHDADDWTPDGTPVNPRCRLCGCGR